MSSRGLIGFAAAALLLAGPWPAAASSASNLMVGVQQNMQATLIAPDGPGPFPGVRSNDKTVPIGAARHLDGILTAARAPHEFHIYESAGHEFERNGTAPDAAADAWRRTLAFLAMHLKQP